MSTSAPTRSVADLYCLVTHAGFVLSTQMTAAFAELGITPRDYCVLCHVPEAERTQIELTEISGLDKSTMVGTVDELEKAGLAERRPPGTDRRARIVSVTEAGRQAVADGAKIPRPRALRGARGAARGPGRGASRRADAAGRGDSCPRRRSRGRRSGGPASGGAEFHFASRAPAPASPS